MRIVPSALGFVLQLDHATAESLPAGLEVGKVVADKANDSRVLIDTIHTSGAEAVMPPRANRQHPRAFDPHVYNTHNLVERFFNRIEHFRRASAKNNHRETTNWRPRQVRQSG